jgi:alkylation response protein AidB-like acyl-CoA dehydrogenase
MPLAHIGITNVNFAMDNDVLALVDSIGDFFKRRGDAQAITEAAASCASADRQRWAALCEMGLPVLRLAEPDGIGAGLLEATVVAEEIGAVLVPEPVIATIVLADAWSSRSAASENLVGLCSGSRITALCGFETVELSAAGDVSGEVTVPDDGVADAVALLARDLYTAESAIVVVESAELPTPVSRTEVDPTRPTAVVNLAGVEPTDVLRISNPSVDRIRRELVLLTAAELVGGMQKVLTDTVDYVKAREQFGRAIGSFQAIKHKLADMYAATEQARAAMQFAALKCADAPDTATMAVASVARWVPGSAISVFEDAIHLHGAMGYSWEISVHLHLRRALATRALLLGNKLFSGQSFSTTLAAV